MIKIKFVDDFISSKVVDDNYSHIEKVKIAYGMEILLENLIKTVIIIGLAFALGGLKYTLVAILSFAILRFFTFGLHCQSGLMCLLLSVFLDVMSPILIKDIYVGTIPRCILMIIYVDNLCISHGFKFINFFMILSLEISIPGLRETIIFS